MRDMVIKSKLWKDQREFDDDEGWGEGLAGYSSSEDDNEFDNDSEGEQYKPKFQSKTVTIRGPASKKTAANSNSNLNHNAPAFIPRKTSKSGETTAAVRIAIATPTSAKNQIVPIKAITTLEETKMSDAMMKPSYNLLDTRAERHIYEEGEEEDILNQCRAVASRKGDLSPMQSRTSKKPRERDRSWGGRMLEEVNIRRPPMRNAKQRQVTQSIITKANRSRA